jgi:hypothetical protein
MSVGGALAAMFLVVGEVSELERGPCRRGFSRDVFDLWFVGFFVTACGERFVSRLTRESLLALPQK